jgi:hypothetical protein
MEEVVSELARTAVKDITVYNYEWKIEKELHVQALEEYSNTLTKLAACIPLLPYSPHEGSLPYSKEPATGLYSQPDESSPPPTHPLSLEPLFYFNHL